MIVKIAIIRGYFFGISYTLHMLNEFEGGSKMPRWIRARSLRFRVIVAVMVICSLLVGSMPLTYAAEAQAEANKSLAKQAQSAVLMDMATGSVLFEKDSHKKMPPASVTKVMTMLLIMEAVKNGKIKLSDKIRTSDHAASMGGSQIFLEPGEEMTLEDMMKGIAISSANDACVAVAEQLAGTEESFVEMMNNKAQQMGMKDTHFVNTNGLPASNHYSTAYDISLMSRELLQYPLILKWTSVYSDYLRKNTEKPLWLVNTNKLIKFYPGMDGLKTGFTGEAKYCLASTASRNQFRLIAVVMGAPTSPIRNQEISQLMDFGFSQYHSKMLYQAGQVVDQIKISKGKLKTVQLVAEKPLGVLLKKGESISGIEKHMVLKELKAPIIKGQVVGYVNLTKNGHELSRINLISNQTIEKANVWDMVKRMFHNSIFFGK